MVEVISKTPSFLELYEINPNILREFKPKRFCVLTNEDTTECVCNFLPKGTIITDICSVDSYRPNLTFGTNTPINSIPGELVISYKRDVTVYSPLIMFDAFKEIFGAYNCARQLEVDSDGCNVELGKIYINSSLFEYGRFKRDLLTPNELSSILRYPLEEYWQCDVCVPVVDRSSETFNDVFDGI